MRKRLSAYILSAFVLIAFLLIAHGTAFAEDKNSASNNGTAPASEAEPSPTVYGPTYHKRSGPPPGPRFRGGPGRRHGMNNVPAPGSTKGPRHKRVITPYGDFCPLCTTYGMGRKAVGMNQALEAMTAYFKSKGLDIKNVKGHGRFLKAEVFHQGVLVDKILFDRRTGRIRSIY
jgi:hypothetical protein